MKINPDRVVIGKRATLELLRSASDRVESVIYAGRGELPDGEFRDLITKAHLKVKNLRGDELTEMAMTDSHQGIALVLKERRYTTLNEIINEAEFRPATLLVMLDGVTDPHNLGAVMRASECFGANGVIWSKNRAVGITPVVTKSAAGSSELLPLSPVGNLADTVRKLKDAGFWCVASALNDRAQVLADFEVPNKMVLILGAEGRGISPLILKLSDYILQVPMEGSISSLNVSQAAGIFLYELRKKLNMIL